MVRSGLIPRLDQARRSGLGFPARLRYRNKVAGKRECRKYGKNKRLLSHFHTASYSFVLFIPVIQVDFFMPADLFLYFREVAGKNSIESRIVCFQFLAGVNLIMFAVAIIRIDLSVHVKPVLDSFRPIFPDVCCGVDIFPAAFGYGCIQRSL